MKILVFSDSHGRDHYMIEALKKHPDAEVAVFLGDGLADFLSLPKGNTAYVSVRGNCDWHPDYSFTPTVDSITLMNKKIVFLHGHTHGVKSGLGAVKSLALDMSADILLFGHTHTPIEYYEDSIYYFNPGSISGSGSAPTYGIITLRENGILLSHGVL